MKDITIFCPSCGGTEGPGLLEDLCYTCYEKIVEYLMDEADVERALVRVRVLRSGGLEI